MATLACLSHLDLLRITCGGCGRTREIPSRFMAMMCGEEVHMNALPYRLRCHVCQYRGNTKVEILAGQVDINGEYFVYHDDRVSRRLF